MQAEIFGISCLFAVELIGIEKTILTKKWKCAFNVLSEKKVRKSERALAANVLRPNVSPRFLHLIKSFFDFSTLYKKFLHTSSAKFLIQTPTRCTANGTCYKQSSIVMNSLYLVVRFIIMRPVISNICIIQVRLKKGFVNT